MNPDRAALLCRFFAHGVPTLWSPMLTPFRAAGRIDRGRFVAHLRFLASHVGGILIPGSTGEGWDMDAGTRHRIVDLAITHAQGVGLPVLIGVLETEATAARDCVLQTADWLCKRARCQDPLAAMAACGVSGFTICPPRGAGLSQRDLREALQQVLETRLPIALYQLPQVTQNEMSPATVATLARAFPNFLFFKDSSGQDRVAQSGRDLGGVFTLRGAESDYSRWTRDAGGPYDGLLLSTTNPFAPQLARILKLLARGKLDEARRLDARLGRVVAEVFAHAAQLEVGNAFANANKALEHWIAHGSAGDQAQPPRLFSGHALPRDLLEQARLALQREKLFPRKGYLQ